MPKALGHDPDLSTKLRILAALVNEENKHVNRYEIPLSVIRQCKEYVKAAEAVLILLDPENPEWAARKLLGDEQAWKSESAFPASESILCTSIPQGIHRIHYESPSDPGFDPIVFDGLTLPITDIILTPLRVNSTTLGALVFINPASDYTEETQYEFLQVIARGLANSIHMGERNRQLVISNADLEATQWQILNSRNTLRTFFDNIPSSVYIVDRTYTIVAINSRRTERLNKKPQELVGEKCYEKLWGYSAPCASCRILDAFNGIPAVRSSRELGANETFVHWEITTVPIREEPGAINQVIVFEEDVTEKWILEANLIQSEKMASIGQLAANVAHEINNPLAAIIANAQLLLRDLADADENTVDSLKLIETAGNRAAKIVSNLLESARREKHYEFEETSLNETIMDAISLLRYEINNRSVITKLDLAKNMPLIFANKNQLKGVWINLINNALGAMVEHRPGKLTISTRYENKGFCIVFKDNGKGILPEHQGHIFEPFFTTKEVGKGTGLGLSVSLQVIKEHHGDIHFETTPGKGTKFIILLPDIDRESY